MAEHTWLKVAEIFWSDFTGTKRLLFANSEATETLFLLLRGGGGCWRLLNNQKNVGPVIVGPGLRHFLSIFLWRGREVKGLKSKPASSSGVHTVQIAKKGEELPVKPFAVAEPWKNISGKNIFESLVKQIRLCEPYRSREQFSPFARLPTRAGIFAREKRENKKALLALKEKPVCCSAALNSFLGNLVSLRCPPLSAYGEPTREQDRPPSIPPLPAFDFLPPSNSLKVPLCGGGGGFSFAAVGVLVAYITFANICYVLQP